ncbi:MAG: hypothetical protein ACLUDU_07845 [Butyricimonas faecihominis]
MNDECNSQPVIQLPDPNIDPSELFVCTDVLSHQGTDDQVSNMGEDDVFYHGDLQLYG